MCGARSDRGQVRTHLTRSLLEDPGCDSTRCHPGLGGSTREQCSVVTRLAVVVLPGHFSCTACRQCRESTWHFSALLSTSTDFHTGLEGSQDHHSSRPPGCHTSTRDYHGELCCTLASTSASCDDDVVHRGHVYHCPSSGFHRSFVDIRDIPRPLDSYLECPRYTLLCLQVRLILHAALVVVGDTTL